MKAHSLSFLLLPEDNPAAAARSLASAGALAATLDHVPVLPSAAHLRDFASRQLPAVTTDFIVLFDGAIPVDHSAISAHLDRLQQAGQGFSGPVVRTAALRSALRAPMVESEPIYDCVAPAWLYFNFAASDPASIPLLATTLPAARSARHALASLALGHHLLCRCPILPETEPLRQATARHAFRSWRDHRRALPREAIIALASILSKAQPNSPGRRLKTWAARFTARFTPISTGRDLRAFCTDIDYHLPGLFGRRALGEPALQPPA